MSTNKQIKIKVNYSHSHDIEFSKLPQNIKDLYHTDRDEFNDELREYINSGEYEGLGIFDLNNLADQEIKVEEEEIKKSFTTSVRIKNHLPIIVEATDENDALQKIKNGEFEHDDLEVSDMQLAYEELTLEDLDEL